MSKQNYGNNLTLDEKITIRGKLALFCISKATLIRMDTDCAHYLFQKVVGAPPLRRLPKVERIVMISLNTQILKLTGLQGTRHISTWQERFIESILESTDNGSKTQHLSSKQVDAIVDIYSKHFAD